MKRMFCIIGQICSGKNTICNMIKQQYSRIHQLVYYTNRPMRDGEEDGVDYHFLKDKTLNIHDDDVIECRVYEAYLGNSNEKILVQYGTVLDDQFNNMYLMVPCAVDQLGFYIDYFGPDKISVIYLNPSKDILIERAMNRGDNLIEFHDRLERDSKWYSEETISKLKAKFSYNSWLELSGGDLTESYHTVNAFIIKNL